MDGIDLHDFDLLALSSNQFNISITDKIRYEASLRKISDKEMVDAAITANMLDFIQSLPEVGDNFVERRSETTTQTRPTFSTTSSLKQHLL